jgi:hypothetical protein
MSLFMKDPKKMAAMVIDHLGKKKATTSDGAEKDHKPEQSDLGSQLLKAIQSNDVESFVNNLRSFVSSHKSELTDEKPETPTESI